MIIVHVVKKKRCSTVLKQELKLLKMSTSVFKFFLKLVNGEKIRARAFVANCCNYIYIYLLISLMYIFKVMAQKRND